MKISIVHELLDFCNDRAMSENYMLTHATHKTKRTAAQHKEIVACFNLAVRAGWIIRDKVQRTRFIRNPKMRAESCNH